MIFTYDKRCKGYHGKWVNPGDKLELTRSAVREEISRGVGRPPKNSDLWACYTTQKESEALTGEPEDEEN